MLSWVYATKSFAMTMYHSVSVLLRYVYINEVIGQESDIYDCIPLRSTICRRRVACERRVLGFPL
jgi:hypothetical protein